MAVEGGYLGEARRLHPLPSCVVAKPPLLSHHSLNPCPFIPPPPHLQREFIEQNLEHVAPVVYTLLSCWTRFHKIGKSPNVIWDEAHFGKFGSHYLKREFYFDVHPPLGKMLVGLAGLLSGYDGSYEFKSGEMYPEHVPYVAMRVILATFGVLMVPLGWYTAVELGMSTRACHLVALMCLCGAFVRILTAQLLRPLTLFTTDVAWLVISRFILLDSMLLFFTFTTVFGLSKFHNHQYQCVIVPDGPWRPTDLTRSFSFDWWFWLTFTGVSIGCVSRYVTFYQYMCYLLNSDSKCQVDRSIRHGFGRSLYYRRFMD
jgi:dolichyl-phosphate-mannose-protein mannosyltransferase